MIKLLATRLVRNFIEIEALIQCSDWSGKHGHIAELFAELAAMCRELELGDQIVSQAQRLVSRFNGDYTEPEIRILLEDLSGAIQHALIEPLFFVVNTQDADYFSIDLKLKRGVLATLGLDAVIDLQEAGKCFALDRFTASIMHCMRVVERILRLIADTRHLKVKLAKRRLLEYADMDEIYKALRSKLDAAIGQPRSKKRADAEHFYSIAADQCLYFKELRNEASHARRIYNRDEAHNALMRVIQFAELLSIRLARHF